MPKSAEFLTWLVAYIAAITFTIQTVYLILTLTIREIKVWDIIFGQGGHQFHMNILKVSGDIQETYKRHDYKQVVSKLSNWYKLTKLVIVIGLLLVTSVWILLLTADAVSDFLRLYYSQTA